MSTGGEIRVEDIQLRPSSLGSHSTTDGSAGAPLGDHLEDVEREAILKALGADEVQQDGRRQNAGDELSCAALSHKEAGYRIKAR